MVSKVADVPYGFHFEHHEKWTVLSTSNTAVKCIVRATDRVKMLKDTSQEEKIRSRSKKDFFDYWEKWVQAVTDRGFLLPKEKPSQVPVVLLKRQSRQFADRNSGPKHQQRSRTPSGH